VLLVLLAVEGATIIRVHSLLTLHVFIGALLVPPVLVKMSSTSWRFAKYYLGTAEYRHKGPPPVALRVLGPFTVILTAIVFVTGFLLLLGPASMRNEYLQLHRASFIAWFAVMVIHVLGHLGDMTRSSTKDWTRRTRQLVAGARARRVVLAASLVVGLGFALVIVSCVGPWLRGSS
jgi:cytochrome c biogenesis protein CcdA